MEEANGRFHLVNNGDIRSVMGSQASWGKQGKCIMVRTQLFPHKCWGCPGKQLPLDSFADLSAGFLESLFEIVPTWKCYQCPICNGNMGITRKLVWKCDPRSSSLMESSAMGSRFLPGSHPWDPQRSFPGTFPEGILTSAYFSLQGHCEEI